MNLTSLSQVRNLLKEIGVVPSRILGQCFLIDRNILDIIIGEADLSPDDRVLEPGPGLGVVTERLVAAVAKVSAVEKDRKLCGVLEKMLGADPSFLLICSDILDVDPGSLDFNKLVSNLPYSIASRFLVDLVRTESRPELCVVTVQDEVAQRITAGPGTGDYGVLSLWLQLDYDCRIVKKVSRSCFWPRPDVTSAVVCMKVRGERRLALEKSDIFYKATKYAFMHRRKQVVSILSQAPGDVRVERDRILEFLRELGIDEKARPENLGIDEWCILVERLYEDG